jgi:hypothetical protein
VAVENAEHSWRASVVLPLISACDRIFGPVVPGNSLVAGLAAFRYSLMSPSHRDDFTIIEGGASVASGGCWSSER